MDYNRMFENCLFASSQKQKLEVSYGYFVHWHHDLHGGIRYHGVFETEEEAIKYADKQTGYDEIHVLYLPYIEFEGKIFALWEGTSCLNTL